MAWTPPTQTEVEGYFAQCNNWGRWGNDDQCGTLNLITPAKRQAALALARRGRAVSLARDMVPHPNLDYQMLFPGTRGERSDVGMDYFGLVFHGTTFTHVDTLCHISYDGQLYNGRAFEPSLSNAGAAWGALDPWFDGITSRGVLLDVAAGRPEGYVTLGNPVTPHDLDAAAARAGLKVEAGDVVVVRSGRALYEASQPYSSGPRPGLHIACITWLRQHDVSAIAWDMHDERPTGYQGFEFGVHLAIPLLGLCLIDNTYPERLVTACAEEGRYEFLFTAMPLRLVGGTGCPVNPVAIL
jgi:kynurenine formamidase